MKPTSTVQEALHRFARSEERGQTMVEYAMLLGLISVALVAAISSIGLTISGFMTSFNVGL